MRFLALLGMTGAEPARVELLRWGNIPDPPPRRWVIQDWIPVGCLSILTGRGAGKSRFALQLAAYRKSAGRMRLGSNRIPLLIADMRGRGPLWAAPGRFLDSAATSLDHAIASLNFPPALVILDSAAAVYGDNENDRRAVRSFLAVLDKRASDLNTGIVLAPFLSSCAAYPDSAGRERRRAWPGVAISPQIRGGNGG